MKTAHAVCDHDHEDGTCVPEEERLHTGFIHSVETGGTVDGPGIRYVLFLTGCPLSCLYCHNPDCMKMKNGVRRSAEDVIHDILDYKTFLKRSGGGVTISGGEPLAQAPFVKDVLRACKAHGLHTALDTSGYLGAKADEELLSLTDLVLLDIKAGLPDVYKKTAGVALQPTLDFAARLAAIGKPVWVRFVLVPGLTDGPDNVEAVARIVSGLPNVTRTDILPFHKMGEYKWAEMGMTYALKDTPEPTDAQVEAARAIFEAFGVKAI